MSTSRGRPFLYGLVSSTGSGRTRTPTQQASHVVKRTAVTQQEESSWQGAWPSYRQGWCGPADWVTAYFSTLYQGGPICPPLPDPHSFFNLESNSSKSTIQFLAKRYFWSTPPSISHSTAVKEVLQFRVRGLGWLKEALFTGLEENRSVFFAICVYTGEGYVTVLLSLHCQYPAASELWALPSPDEFSFLPLPAVVLPKVKVARDTNWEKYLCHDQCVFRGFIY